jgi:hypothetical protein
MTRRSRLAILAAVLLLEIAFVFLAPGVPVRWTKGIVLPEGCSSVADAYACQVELVSDGSRVTARSDRAIASGDGVRLLAWHDLTSGEQGYTIVY